MFRTDETEEENLVREQQQQQDRNSDVIVISSPSANYTEDNVPDDHHHQSGESSGCISRIKSFRFEMLILLVLIILVAIPSFLFLRKIHTDFDFHGACVDCFNREDQPSPQSPSSPSPLVFNQSSGECLPLANISSDASTATIVYEASYCGAPECQSMVVTRGVRPVPYWIMIMSCIFGIITSTVINLLKDCLEPAKRRCYDGCEWEQPAPDLISDLAASAKANPENEGLQRLSFILRAVRSFGMMDPYFYCFLYFLTLAHFVYIVYDVHTSHYYDSLTQWDKYETVYAFLNNSGTIQVILFFYPQFLILGFVDGAGRRVDEENKWLERESNKEHKRKFDAMMFVPMMAFFDEKDSSDDEEEPEKNDDKSSRSGDSKGYTKRKGQRNRQQRRRQQQQQQHHLKKHNSGTGMAFMQRSNSSGLYSNSSFSSPPGPRRSPMAVAAFLIHTVPFLLLPIIVTHVIPASMIFLPSALAILLPYSCMTSLLGRESVRPDLKTSDGKIYTWLFMCRLIGSLVVICFVQTLTNYSIMFYSGEYSWPEVIRNEFSHRSTECYANAFLNKLQIYNAGFVGLMFS